MCYNFVSFLRKQKSRSGFQIKFGMTFLWFLLFGICSLVIPSDAATYLDPSLKWKTLETLHFKINYYPAIEDKVVKMASIAEEVHSRLSPLFKHVPDLKTEVVLMDTTDYTNGFTTVIPNPLITIYLSDIGSNLIPFNYDDWLKYVFIHEYTHLLHLDTVEGGAKLFKFLFGREIFPNALNPRFLIEGLAVYIETHKDKGGRGTNPRWLAQLRMDALEGNFKSIDQASVDTVKWPMGTVSYLYGYSFLEYLSKTYGEAKLYRMSQEYGDYLLSYGIDGAFQNIYGKSLWVLWQDWQEDLIKNSKAEKEKIKKKPLTKAEILTASGYYNVKPKWSLDSTAIYYAQMNMDDLSQVRKIDINDKSNTNVFDGRVFDDSLSIRGQKLFFSKGNIYNNFYYFKDLYSYDLKDRSTRRITYGARASDPSVSPDGSQIVFVKNNKGTRSLWIMGVNSTTANSLGSTDDLVQYYSPIFSPDGTKIITAKWQNGKQKLFVIDPVTNKETVLFTQNMSLEANPTFSPDGRYVLFDSDVDGITNIYSYDTKEGKTFKVTNVLGMAIMPDVSPDQKKLAYVNYTSKGYDVAVIDFDPTKWKQIGSRDSLPRFPVGVQSAVSVGQASFESEDDVILSRYDYNPIPTLIPKLWFPYSYYNENGSHMLAYTVGMDALYQQMYQIQAGFDWTAKRPTYAVSYINNQFLPQISVGLSDVAYPYSWDSGAATYWERQRAATVGLTLVSNRVFNDYDRQSATLGFDQLQLSNVTSSDVVLTAQPTLGNLRGVSLIYNYGNSRSYGYSISPEDGFDLLFYLRSYSKSLSSDFNLNTYLVRAVNYFKMPIAHNVLSLHATGVLNRGDSFVQSGFNYSNLLLRGYPSGILSGNKAGIGSMQYHFPIAYPESGFGYGYLFFDRLFGNLFFDSGSASFGRVVDMIWKRSYGAELNLNTVNGWGMFPVMFTLGYAKGLDDGGEEQFYFNFSL